VDSLTAPAAVGDTVRTGLSSWASSLAVLNVLLLTAMVAALVVPLSLTHLQLGALLVAYLTFLWHRTMLHPHDPLEIDTVYLAFFGIYVVVPIVTFVALQEAVGMLGGQLIGHFEPEVVTVAIAALFGFVLGYALPVGQALGNSAPRVDGVWRRSEGVLIASALLLVGTALVGALVARVGPDTYLSSTYVSGFEAEAGSGLLAAGVILCQLVLIVLYLAMTERGKSAPLVPILLFLLLAVVMFRVGRRRVVLETALALLAVHHFQARRVRKLTLVIGAVVSFVIFMAIGQARSYQGEGFDRVLEYFSYEFTFWNPIYALAEPVTVLLALTETMEQVPAQEGFRLGQTFIDAFETLIPFPIHPNRPLTPAQWFVNLVDPVTAAAGGGYSYALIAEGYLNFGILGSVLVTFVEGVALRGVVSYRLRCPASKSRLLIYSVVFSSTVMLIRGDFATLLKVGVVSAGLPAVAIAAWLGRRETAAVVREGQA